MKAKFITLGVFLLSLFQSSLSTSCTVSDIQRGHDYDLSPLAVKSGENWRVISDHYIYLLNICQPLVSESIDVSGIPKSCDQKDTQGCQIDTQFGDQKPKNLGAETKLTVKGEGEIELEILGGDHCTRVDADRSVLILFHCNKAAGIGSPLFVEEDDSCTYIMEWETSYACPILKPTLPPLEPQHCMITENGLRFDLTPLTLSIGNWIVNEGDYTYLINICGEVHNIDECKGQGACQLKPSDPSFVKQLGSATARPVVQDGVLKIKMTGGKSCHGGSYQRQTTIIFTCLEGESLGLPEFLHETDSCEYVFAWETSAACGEPVDSQCAVKDLENDRFVDLSPLRAEEGGPNHSASSAISGDKATYKVNICAGLNLNDNPCREGTSICKIEESESTGISLGSYGSLLVDDGDVVMRYSDGDLCPGTDERITSDIYFICDPKAPLHSSPRLLSNKNNCQYLFNWRTKYACESSAGGGGGGGSSLSGGMIAFIVILSLFSAYFLGGVAYNRFVRKEKGLEQIPHFSFCQACYFTVADKFSRSGGGNGSIQI